jgi:hypothetical protein
MTPCHKCTARLPDACSAPDFHMRIGVVQSHGRLTEYDEAFGPPLHVQRHSATFEAIRGVASLLTSAGWPLPWLEPFERGSRIGWPSTTTSRAPAHPHLLQAHAASSPVRASVQDRR